MCIYVRTLGLNIWEVLMKIEEYLQLLSEGKVDEARKVRFSTIPSKLIKFIWLMNMRAYGYAGGKKR